MASSTFKVGDRVRWPGDRWSKPDSGTVTVIPEEYALTLSGHDTVWVKWDSNGKVLHIDARDIRKCDGLLDI